MKIQWFRSATVGIYSKSGTSILCDPWITDGAFIGSWFHWPPLEGFEFSELAEKKWDALYISHFHADHFDRKLVAKIARNSPNTKVLIPFFENKWLKRAVENCGFRPRPYRTQGTFSKYNSIDDKIDDLHYYTTFIKFGIGRATYDVSQELRNDHLSIEEGKKLIKKYDGEFPDRYFSEIMKNYRITEKFFFKLCDKFRSPHLWKKIKNKWHLRHTVNKDGTND
jgi:hypothetical protein